MRFGSNRLVLCDFDLNSYPIMLDSDAQKTKRKEVKSADFELNHLISSYSNRGLAMFDE